MKILIITKNWLGDLFFQIPSIQLIAKSWPDAEIICMAPPRCAVLLKSLPYVSEVLSYDEKNENRSLLKRFSIILKLRKLKCEKAFIFHRSKTRAFIAWASGCREVVGFSTKGKQFLTHAVKPPQSQLHHVDYFLYLLNQYGLPEIANASYQLPVSGDDDQFIEDVLVQKKLSGQSFACFHLGANWEPKRWPVESFVRLAALIYEKHGWPAVITGAESDRRLADDFAARAQTPAIILTGKTSLTELGALFKRAACLISGDSGPMHIAAAVGCRVVALFGPTSPALTGPRGCGHSLVISYVPPGYEVPYYGHSLPESGWLSHIKPEEVIVQMETAGWFTRARLNG